MADFKNFTNCYGIQCLTNKPTRITDHSSTLLDHLYTNESRITIHSGICIWDVSDHYPIFCIVPSTKSYRKCKKLYTRDTILFETKASLSDFNAFMNCFARPSFMWSAATKYFLSELEVGESHCVHQESILL